MGIEDVKADGGRLRNLHAVKLGARACLEGLPKECPFEDVSVRRDWECGYELVEKARDE